jgi:hypothetical protein
MKLGRIGKQPFRPITPLIPADAGCIIEENISG